MALKNMDVAQLRNLLAFWLLGLCNNYGYVIMLSAAEDIMDVQHGMKHENVTSVCEEKLTSRHCSVKPIGGVLLADNLPTLFVKLTFPFFMHRIPFGIRHALVCILQTTSYFVVAYSQNVAMSLIGVAFASLGSGIGEISYLALSSFFPSATISAWSSGTGGAGLIGSFSYAFLTEATMANLSPRTALLIQVFIPVIFAITYWFILVIPKSVYTPSFNPRTWVVPIHAMTNTSSSSQRLSLSSDNENVAEYPQRYERIKQRNLTFSEKLNHVVPLIHLMVPLAIVYTGEYLINQGLTQMIFFNCAQGFRIAIKGQYRWYQVLYQFGVFLSRSSVRLFELPTWTLYILPILQISNCIFFLFEALYWFVPSIGIIFVLIVFEGLLGGAAYVNTFNKIHKMVAADVREYSLSIASLGDSIGVNCAGFAAIPLHNFICGKPLPIH